MRIDFIKKIKVINQHQVFIGLSNPQTMSISILTTCMSTNMGTLL